MSSVAKQAQKILISNCANDDFTGKDGNNYAFRIVNITTRTQGYAGAEYIHKNLMSRGNRYFTIAHDFAFGRLSVGYFKERMKALNPKAEFIGEAWPKINKSDYTSFITALIEAKPDVVFFSWAVGLPFWQQSAPFELTKKFAMVSSYWGGSDELQQLPKAEIPSGAVMGGFPYYAIDSAANRAFVEEFQKTNGRPPRTAAYFEVISLQALRAAIEKASSIDTDNVIKALSGLQYEFGRRPGNGSRLRSPGHDTALDRQGGMGRKAQHGRAQRHHQIADQRIPADGSRYRQGPTQNSERHSKSISSARARKLETGPVEDIALQFVSGLLKAMFLFLLASGLSLIFGVSRILNIMHGAFYALGAYLHLPQAAPRLSVSAPSHSR